jgi:hypothetical protein
MIHGQHKHLLRNYCTLRVKLALCERLPVVAVTTTVLVPLFVLILLPQPEMALTAPPSSACDGKELIEKLDNAIHATTASESGSQEPVLVAKRVFELHVSQCGPCTNDPPQGRYRKAKAKQSAR